MPVYSRRSLRVYSCSPLDWFIATVDYFFGLTRGSLRVPLSSMIWLIILCVHFYCAVRCAFVRYLRWYKYRWPSAPEYFARFVARILIINDKLPHHFLFCFNHPFLCAIRMMSDRSQFWPLSQSDSTRGLLHDFWSTLLSWYWVILSFQRFCMRSSSHFPVSSRCNQLQYCISQAIPAVRCKIHHLIVLAIILIVSLYFWTVEVP